MNHSKLPVGSPRPQPSATANSERQAASHILRSWAACWQVIALVFICCGCGYQVRSSVRKLPAGIQSLGIPTFRNATNQYKLEQQISSAVIKEFGTRTRMPITSSKTGVDAVLVGEIRSMSSSPVIFGTDTFASAFLVTVQLSVQLVRTSDSKVLWQNTGFLFRERYVLNSKLSDFFSEENPALERLSREFATSLVSTILNSSIP
ncbi:MAG TPA: LPS assembly lipoprotein LptE [Acidobacteriota bacterium]|nr:LPS assembly lipoprotein LptE [Acidobacteriota bacterium]